MSQRDVIFQCRIVAAELRGTNSDMKIGGGLRRNRGGVQLGGSDLLLETSGVNSKIQCTTHRE